MMIPFISDLICCMSYVLLASGISKCEEVSGSYLQFLRALWYEAVLEFIKIGIFQLGLGVFAVLWMREAQRVEMYVQARERARENQLRE